MSSPKRFRWPAHWPKRFLLASASEAAAICGPVLEAWERNRERCMAEYERAYGDLNRAYDFARQWVLEGKLLAAINDTELVEDYSPLDSFDDPEHSSDWTYEHVRFTADADVVRAIRDALGAGTVELDRAPGRARFTDSSAEGVPVRLVAVAKRALEWETGLSGRERETARNLLFGMNLVKDVWYCRAIRCGQLWTREECWSRLCEYHWKLAILMFESPRGSRWYPRACDCWDSLPTRASPSPCTECLAQLAGFEQERLSPLAPVLTWTTRDVGKAFRAAVYGGPVYPALDRNTP